MEDTYELSEHENNEDTQDSQSNSNLQMLNCSDSLEEMEIRDPPTPIQPGPPVQQSTPGSTKNGKNRDWLKEIGEQSKNRKMAKEAANDKTKPLAHNGNSRKGRPAKKQRRCDGADKENCKPEKPEKSNQQNGENTPEVPASCHPEQEKNSQCSPASLPAYITCVFKGKEENVPVKKDEAVIDFIQTFKPVGKSDIILYLDKLEATINPYVRCSSLGEGERLTIIKRRQAKNSKINSSQIPASNYPEHGKGKFFKVQSKGITEGRATRNILSDDKWSWEMKPLAVFGLTDETIEEAIMNDKRFTISGTLSLKDPNKTVTERRDLCLSSLKTDVVYEVQIEKGVATKTEKSRRVRSNNQNDISNTEEASFNVPHSSSDPKSKPPGQTTDLPRNYRSATSEKFSSAFAEITSGADGQKIRSDIIEDCTRNVLSKEAMSVTDLRLLTQHLDNVALIRVPHGKVGTFFLLIKSLGLTCYHVLEQQLADLDWKQKPTINLEMSFNYEKESDQMLNCQVQAVFWDQNYDFVFLGLLESERGVISPTQEGAASVAKDHVCRPRGLLEYVAPPPQEGTVSIIGHPNGSIKKIDLRCSVINFNKRPEAIAATLLSDRSYLHTLTQHNYQRMSRPELVTYNTCLYWGASGSPVFDDQGGLVAMHTGGYPIDTKLKKKSVIEYGRNLVDILIFGAIHIPELQGWFKNLPKGKLADYMNKYIEANGHSVMMQPVIREFLQHFNNNGEQNPNCNDSGIADSLMDTSE